MMDTTDMADERDPLTGLIRMEAAERQIAAWQSRAMATGAVPIQAVLLRLRRFSSVNLAYGAAAGDRALVEVAARITQLFDLEFGQDRLVARAGGGAFLVAAAQDCSRERWEWLAEELARLIARPIADRGGGIVRLRPRMALLRGAPGETPDRMLGRLADTLDRAQEQPGRLLLWVDGGNAFGERRAQQLEADLLGALDRGEIEVLFQPQFGSSDGLVGAEALARWRHPELGRIGAEGLFAIAARADHVAPLSRHIAHVALNAAASWPEPLRLSLNVTAADLATAEFASEVMRAVTNSGFPPDRLTLEITEESLVWDLERSGRQLEQLVAFGIRFALDDFGAGFCNFRYLKCLPLHALKLDRSMVEGIVENERDLAVLRGIIAMGSALNLAVIAEGVESEEQRDAVVWEGCAAWQGFLGAPPMTAGEFAALAQASGNGR
jgi:EAL domain-containing protein (putative c-di-GMP-specific phosphodiesterase class I)/GGDEF domain-containing protein